MVRERERNGWPGVPILVLLLLLGVGLFANVVWLIAVRAHPGLIALTIVLSFLTWVILMSGLFIVNPNEARVMQLFGTYVGSAKVSGLHYANPFFSKKRISLRVRSFESAHLKVNDRDGNPIEIGAVVVWKVVDTAEALFEVDNYENYVHVQTESALRNMATSYPYDAHDDEKISLRGHTASIADHLRKEIQDRLSRAGVDVVEARITHLAYAPEIAAAMLQRQQAGAIIAARSRIVEGAVGMVEMALEMLSTKEIVHLDEERKAAMVSNLLVVLCSERGTQPVLNAGTLHH
jgi:regulator of protease activity HflC (stomatin/prohibitin superfamily)